MTQYINPNKVIAAKILDPYANTGEPWDHISTRGWQVSFIVGYLPDCCPITIIVDKESEEDCIALIESFGLITI